MLAITDACSAPQTRILADECRQRPPQARPFVFPGRHRAGGETHWRASCGLGGGKRHYLNGRKLDIRPMSLVGRMLHRGPGLHNALCRPGSPPVGEQGGPSTDIS
jgi:hypothetical protein